MEELTPEQEKVHVQALQDLLLSEGWKIILKRINLSISVTEEKLFGEIPVAKGESVNRLQDERKDRILLRDMPERIIKEYTEEDQTKPDIDVYDETDAKLAKPVPLQSKTAVDSAS